MLPNQQVIVDYSATHNVVSTVNRSRVWTRREGSCDLHGKVRLAFSRFTAVVVPGHRESFSVLGDAFMRQKM